MEEPKSKSQKKRDAEALQNLGVKLIDLTTAKLDSLPLSPELRQAILVAKTIKSHGAVRRQAQLIGKLMRAIDAEALQAAYETLIATDKGQTAIFHQSEQWRQRLLSNDSEALTEFIDTYHPADIQKLRQLIVSAIKAQQSNKDLGASTALFRFIKKTIDALI